MNKNSPIGVFDSGIGGLTVVRALLTVIPDLDIVYFGDTARVPYGTKSDRTVTRLTLECIRFLAHYDVGLVVVACNTASSIALAEVTRTVDVHVGSLRQKLERNPSHPEYFVTVHRRGYRFAG